MVRIHLLKVGNLLIKFIMELGPGMGEIENFPFSALFNLTQQRFFFSVLFTYCSAPNRLLRLSELNDSKEIKMTLYHFASFRP
jgi:hypothetical protein